MAFERVNITKDEWTLIGDNVTSITFQNVSQFPFYVNFNSSNTAPSEDVGLVYGPWQGELKKDVTEMTYKTTPNYAFAKVLSKPTSLVVETE